MNKQDPLSFDARYMEKPMRQQQTNNRVDLLQKKLAVRIPTKMGEKMDKKSYHSSGIAKNADTLEIEKELEEDSMKYSNSMRNEMYRMPKTDKDTSMYRKKYDRKQKNDDEENYWKDKNPQISRSTKIKAGKYGKHREDSSIGKIWQIYRLQYVNQI
jgi:hypothetical protein